MLYIQRDVEEDIICNTLLIINIEIKLKSFIKILITIPRQSTDTSITIKDLGAGSRVQWSGMKMHNAVIVECHLLIDNYPVPSIQLRSCLWWMMNVLYAFIVAMSDGMPRYSETQWAYIVCWYVPEVIAITVMPVEVMWVLPPLYAISPNVSSCTLHGGQCLLTFLSYKFHRPSMKASTD